MSELFLAVDIMTGVLAVTALVFLIATFRPGGAGLKKKKVVHGGARYSLSGKSISFDDFGEILDSLESQFRDQDIDYILGLGENGYIVGRMLAARLSPDLEHLVPCTRVAIHTAEPLGDDRVYDWEAPELQIPTTKGYLGKEKPRHIAILTDFDPTGRVSDPVANLILGAFPTHRFQRVYLAVTKDQQSKFASKLKKKDDKKRSEGEPLWAVTLKDFDKKKNPALLELPWTVQ